MSDQLSVFDMMSRDEIEYPDWHNMELKEIAGFVGSVIGVGFTEWDLGSLVLYKGMYDKYIECEIGMSTYHTSDARDGKPYISMSITNKKTTFGVSAGYEDLKDVIKKFDYYIKEMKEENLRVDEPDENPEEDGMEL